MATRPTFHNLAFVGLAALAEITGASALAGPPVKLNGPLVAGGNVTLNSALFSADGSRVFYVANQDTYNLSELYSVPSGGGAAVKLNDPLAGRLRTGSGNVQYSFLASPDGAHVYYVAGPDNGSGVFSAPSAGGPSVNLSGPLTANQHLGGWDLGSDGNRLVYNVYNTYDPLGPNIAKVFSVPITGGTPTLLASPSGGGSFKISPDNIHVTYGVDNGDVLSVPIVGGASVKLYNAIGSAGGDSFSPDGSRVLYLATQDTAGVNEFYSVPTAGGPSVKLNGPLVPGGTTSRYGGFSAEFNADGSRVVYRADQDTLGRFELYSVPSTGGTSVKLTGGLANSTKDGGHRLSPDGAEVLFAGAQELGGKSDLYIVPITGGAPLKLNGSLNIVDYANLFTPDSSRVIFDARQDASGPLEVYSVPSGGGTPVKLNGPLVAGGNAGWWDQGSISPDSSRFVYVTVQTGGPNELFIVPTAGGTPVKLSGDLDLDSRVQFSPDGSRVLLQSRQVQGVPIELYSRVVREQWKAVSGNWDAAANWDKGETPDDVMRITIAGPANVLASGNAVSRTLDELQLGGGVGTSILTLQSGAVITAINGVVVEASGFLGGSGSIAGRLSNSGDVSPGASHGTLEVEGNYSQTAAGRLRIELAGASSFDQLHVSGAVALDGALDVSLVDSFIPHEGDSFNILDFASLTGAFSAVNLPGLAGPLRWDTSQLNASGLLSVVLPGDYNHNGIVDSADYTMWRDALGQTGTGLAADGNGNGAIDNGDYIVWKTNLGNSAPVSPATPGDYNHNGIVDAADYTLWRESLGSTTNLAADGNGNGTIDAGDYDVWKTNFGTHAGSGAGGAAGVPEPRTLPLAALGLILLVICSRRRVC